MKKLLLFIHGLSGSKKSFGDFKKYIKDDNYFEEYEVDYYEYPTIKLLSPSSWITAPKIQSLATGLRTDIVTKYKSKP